MTTTNPLVTAHISDIAAELDAVTAITLDLAGTIPQSVVDALLAAVARAEDCAALLAAVA